jgi:hypothetical protein
LDNVVPRAGAQRGDLLRASRVGRHDDERRHEADLPRLTQANAKIDGVSVLEVVAEHDDVRRGFLDELDGPQPGARADDAPAGGIEHGCHCSGEPPESLGDE